VRARFLLASIFILPVACERPVAGSSCDPIDPVLAGSSFVVVTRPLAGSRLPSPFRVQGCSRTFESTVNWELHARNGQVLASGYASGGGVDGPSAFSFSVSYSVEDAQPGHLEVFEVDASEGEGYPASRSVIPIVLVAAR
jgi:hypothetical protein